MMWLGDWGMHWLWMLLFWAAAIGLIVRAAARLTPSEAQPDLSGRARMILDERYARGELDDDEYRSRRHELEP